MAYPARPLILVCDDEMGPRLSLQIMLKPSCDVVLTETAAAGVRVAERTRFDAAVIDWSMPHDNLAVERLGSEEAGATLITRLRAVDPALSIIVWTACGEATREKAMDLGAYSTMPKPLDPDLAERVVIAAAAATHRRRQARQSV